jgi:predicted phosphodiesterase
MLKKILSLLLLIGCAPEYSPWQSNPSKRDLTAKHLAWLESKNINVPFKVALTGDPQAVIGHFDRVKDAINARDDIDFAVVLGDITDRGLKREWDWAGDIIEEFDVPVLTVVGNHDGLNNAKDIYPTMFGPFNYTFMVDGLKFVMWNNNRYEWGTPDFVWLANSVAGHRAVVMSHQPPGNDALTPADNEEWSRIRGQGDVVASVHGHVHHYGYKHETYDEGVEVDVYTVDRVTGTHYGTMSVDKEYNITFENCSPICERIGE